MTARKITTKAIAKSATTYKGRTGEIFYDTATATLRLSNGSTAGGISFSGGAPASSLVNGSYTVALGGDGGLYFPGGSSLGGSLAPNEFALFSNPTTHFSIYTSDTINSHSWTFGTDGSITVPNINSGSGLKVNDGGLNGSSVFLGPKFIDMYTQRNNGGAPFAEFYLQNDITKPDTTPIARIRIQDDSAIQYDWTFGADGSLELPANSTIKVPSGRLYLGADTNLVTLPGLTTIDNALIINLFTYISGTLDYSSYTLGGAIAVGSDSHTYDGVQAIATSGVGDIAGVFFTIHRGGSSYSSIITSAIGIGQGQIGSGFAVGDTLTFAGASLGGTTPTNNLTVTINTVRNTYPTGADLGYGTLIYDSTTNHIMSFNLADYSWMQIDRQTVARTPSGTLNIADTTTTGTVNIASNMTTGGLVNIGGNGGVSIGNLSVSALTVLNPLPYIWLSLYQYYSGSLLTSSFGTITGTAVGATRVVTGVTQSSTSGRGTGAQFQVTVYNNGQSGGGLVISYTAVSINYNVGNPQYGSGYAVGDTVTIAGASLGGTTPTNNMTFTVGNAVKNNYPAGLEGGMIYDYTSKHFMVYNGSTWIQLDNPLTPNGTKASNAYGVAGQTSYDANYSYTCIATNTWRRVALGSTY